MANRQRLQRVVKDSTCTLENGLTVLAEHEQATRKYFDGMPKDTLRCFENSTKASIRRKRLLLGLPVDDEKQPTMEYFWSFMGHEQVIDECRAKDLVIKGITVYTKDNEGNRHSVVFDGLKLITNN